MHAIRQTSVGPISVRLIKRPTNHVLVIEDGGPLVAINPRGSDRAHAVRCFGRAVDLAKAEQEDDR